MLCPAEPDKTIALQSHLATTPGITALGGWKVHHQASPHCLCEIPLSAPALRCGESTLSPTSLGQICPVGCNRSAGSARSDLERVRPSLLWCPRCLPFMPHPGPCSASTPSTHQPGYPSDQKSPSHPSLPIPGTVWGAAKQLRMEAGWPKA